MGEGKLKKNAFPSHAGCGIPHSFPSLRGYPAKKCFNIIEKRSQFSFIKEYDCAISKRCMSTTIFFFFRDVYQNLNETFFVLKNSYNSIKANT